jgi:hypothetical protein
MEQINPGAGQRNKIREQKKRQKRKTLKEIFRRFFGFKPKYSNISPDSPEYQKTHKETIQERGERLFGPNYPKYSIKKSGTRSYRNR